MISNTNCYIEHVGDGELKVFNFGFPAENVSEIKCKVADKSGGVAELQSTEYSVTLNDSNSYVTLTVPLPAGNILRIYRKTAITQELEFDDGVINNSDICKSMDKLTRISQEISNSIERISLIGPQGEKGDKGEQGERGEKGEQGPQGETNTLIVGTLDVGDHPNVSISGEPPLQILNITFPVAPVGTITPFAGRNIPEGWLLCDGSAISRAYYTALFSVIGTTYGEGDSSFTFNLPDFTDKIPQGAGSRGAVGAALSESLPNIRGEFGEIQSVGVVPYGNGVFSLLKTVNRADAANGYTPSGTIVFNAGAYSAVYKDDAHVQQDAVLVNYIIKY